MNAKEISKGIVWAILQLLGIAIILWLLLQLQTLIIYMIIAGVVSLIGRPINQFFINRLRLKNGLATTFTLIILLGLLISIFSLFVPLLIQQGENLSLLDVEGLKVTTATLIQEISVYFQLDNSFWQQQLAVDNLFQNVNFGLLPELLNQVLELLGGFTIGLFSVIFSIVLAIFKVENAFIIAFLCALLNLIPYLGPIIGGVLMMILTMTSFIGADFSTVIIPKTLYVMMGFVLGQLIDNFFSQPFIFSNSVKSHPLEIFIVILASGTLLGPVGMIIAIPLYTTLKVISQEFLAENKIVKSLTKNF